jgi:hypothetical protein
MPLDDYERATYDRATMIGNALSVVDPDLPLIIIGQETSGNIHVWSTHGGQVTERILKKIMTVEDDDEDDPWCI